MAYTYKADAETRILINDQQAHDSLKALAERSRELNDQMNKMRKANDNLGFKKAKKELLEVKEEQSKYKKVVVDVQKVLDNLSGTSINNLKKAQRELSKEVKNLSRDTKDEIAIYNQKRDELRRVNAELDKTKTKTKEAGVATNKFGEIAKKIGPWLLATFSIGAITGFVSGIIRVRQEFEKYEAVLTNTLGSKSAAQESLKMIQDFASKTPFQVTELTGAFVKLANMGFKPTREEMRKMGDLASSTGKGFDQLAEAIIDAQTGQFERLKEFGVRGQKEGDKVMFTFKGVKQEVDFTTDSIKNYITSLGDLQGVSGSMAAISATLGGKISNLGDAWDSLMNTMGKMTSGIFTAVIGGMTSLVGWTQKLIEIPASETLEKERTEMNLLFNSILSLNEGNDARNRLLTELQTKYPEYFANQDIEKMNNAELLKLQTGINDQFLKRIQLAVYEEELTAMAERGKEIKKQELNAIKDINRIYEQYIENKQEGLTVEQKAQAILDANLKASGATATMYGEVQNSAAGVKGEIKNYMSAITDSQKEQNELSKEYTTILTEQQKLLLANPDLLPQTPDKKPETEPSKGNKKSVIAQMYMPTEAEYEEFQTALDLFNETMTEAIFQGISTDEASMMQAVVDSVILQTTQMHEKLSAIEAKNLAEKKKQRKQDQLDSLNTIADTLSQGAALFKEDTVAYRLLSSAQALINTYTGATMALTDKTIPNTFARIAAGITVIVAGLANVAKINAVQFAGGKYDVIGASDGKTYRAGYAPTAKTGIYQAPTLIGDGAPELVVDGPTLRNMQMNAPGLIQAILQMRVPQYASGNYGSSQSKVVQTVQSVQPADSSILIGVLNVLTEMSAKLDNPTRAAISYSDLDKAMKEVETIKYSVSK